VGGGTEIWRIDATKITHINYAFARIDEYGEVHFTNPEASVHLSQLQALKAKNPLLKILVSVGGWGADGFSDAALSSASRHRFAGSIVRMIERYSLDGVDLDWEFPGQPGPGIAHRPEDKENFTLLLETIRERLDALSDARGYTGEDRFLLTIASNDDQDYFEFTQMEKLHIYLDFVNVMTYDFFTVNSETTGHHTGLYKSTQQNAPERTAAASIQRHLGAGIPPEKIVLGVAFYGRGWKGVNPDHNGLNQPYKAFDRAYSYSVLKDDYIDRNGYRRYWDESARAPYLWNPDSLIFISYEDVESLEQKAAFIRQYRLGGVMYWQHSHDPSEELLGTLYEALRRR
jgi:chitinase